MLRSAGASSCSFSGSRPPSRTAAVQPPTERRVLASSMNQDSACAVIQSQWRRSQTDKSVQAAKAALYTESAPLPEATGTLELQQVGGDEASVPPGMSSATSAPPAAPATCPGVSHDLVPIAPMTPRPPGTAPRPTSKAGGSRWNPDGPQPEPPSQPRPEWMEIGGAAGSNPAAPNGVGEPQSMGGNAAFPSPSPRPTGTLAPLVASPPKSMRPMTSPRRYPHSFAPSSATAVEQLSPGSAMEQFERPMTAVAGCGVGGEQRPLSSRPATVGRKSSATDAPRSSNPAGRGLLPPLQQKAAGPVNTPREATTSRTSASKSCDISGS